MKKRTAGFTLLELLIGMTLLGFILALLFGGFRLAVNSWDAVETRLQRSADEHAALALVRRLVGSVQPLRWKRLPGQPLAFVGQRDRLLLVAPLTEQAGLRAVELAIDPEQQAGPPTLHLVLREGPVRYDAERFAESVAEARVRPLLGQLQGAGFSFFGSLQQGESPRWHEAWESAEQFPSLVRLQLAPRDGDAIDLIVATTVSGDRSARVRLTAGPQ